MSEVIPDKSLHDFSYASARIKAIEQIWTREIMETERRRLVRYIQISVEKMRAEKTIKSDAFYIPRRIADSNIRREQAPMVAYMTQAPVVAKFVPQDELPIPVEPVEKEFSKVSKYKKWLKPFLETFDGGQTHGWDGIEVLFDETKPGHFRNRHIGHGNLWFGWDVEDIQDAPVAILIYGATTSQLAEYVEDYDFDAEATAEVAEKAEAEQAKSQSKVKIHKIYFKDPDDGLVYVGWWSEWATKWLKAPEKLFLGVYENGNPVFEEEYPIELFEYSISEDETVTNSKGRVFLDEHDQEACTQLITAYVNRSVRSSYIMFAPKNPQDDSAQKQSECKIGDGIIWDEPMDIFYIDPPDVSLLSGEAAITTANAAESGQVNFAVNNRKDSRKTAREVDEASKQGAMLGGVQVVLVSEFVAGVQRRDWRIFKSQVLAGKIQSNLPQYQMAYQREYELVPAGDAYVVKRQQIQTAMKQDWPVIQTTGAAQPFLEDLIRMSPYAENADKYISAMEAANRKDNLLRGMSKALTSLSTDPATGKATPIAQKFAPQLAEIAQQYQSVMAPPGQQPEQPQEQPA